MLQAAFHMVLHFSEFVYIIIIVIIILMVI